MCVRKIFGAARWTKLLPRRLLCKRGGLLSDMGNLLEVPITDKTSSFGENQSHQTPTNLRAWSSFATCTMQGWRSYNEDTISAQPPFFGVFDGHGGRSASLFASEHLLNVIRNMMVSVESPVDEESAFKRAFTTTDLLYMKPLQDEMQAYREKFPHADPEVMRGHFNLHLSEEAERGAGTTACVVFVASHALYVGNAGDSRAVLCRDGKALSLSEDHKPDLDNEKRRIENAEGMVFRNRVNGILATSRALGDAAFKEQLFLQPPGAFPVERCAVTSDPEVMSYPILRGRDAFFVIATDGVWDVMSNQEVVDFVIQKRNEGVHPTKICEQLLDACITEEPAQGLGTDNMSVVIVFL